MIDWSGTKDKRIRIYYLTKKVFVCLVVRSVSVIRLRRISVRKD